MTCRPALAPRPGTPPWHPALARRLGTPEAAGLSVAVVCPSVGMAFNVSLCAQAAGAQAAGAAAPLIFLLGTAVMLVVAASFAAFSRRMPHAGAAYEQGLLF